MADPRSALDGPPRGGGTGLLLGRPILITGSGEGLGRAIAARCIAEGASVMLCGRRAGVVEAAAAALSATLQPGQVVAARGADVSDEGAVAMLIADTIAQLGGIEGIVNNAAIQGPIGRVEDVDWYSWRKTIEVDFLAPVMVARAVVPILRAQGRGSIINLSGGGATSPRARFSAYGCAKTALVRFTETLARELDGSGVNVNAVAPGRLDTAMRQEILSAGQERAGRDAFEEAATEPTDGERMLRKAAALCVYLLSDLGAGITGRLISSAWDPWHSLSLRQAALADSDIYTLRRIVPEDRGLDWTNT